MPTRMLRDGILSSDRVNLLTAPEEVFYRRLMSVVDDYGRFIAHAKLIRAACFPLKLESVSDSDIGKWLLATEKAGLVRVYPASDGKRYLELLDFGQRIQSKSKYPEPSGDSPKVTVNHGDPPESTAVVGVGVGVEGVVGREADPPPRKRGKPNKTPLPENFGISDRVRKWAEQRGFDRLTEHLESFCSKARARAYTYADWDDAFMEAVREDWAKLRVAKVGGSARQRPSL